MDRRAFLAAAGATVSTALAGCASGDGRDYDVAMVSNAFLPVNTVSVPPTAPDWIPAQAPTVEVQAGDAIVWENTDSRIHTVTAATRRHPEAETMLGPSEKAQAGDVPRLPDPDAFFASGDFEDEIAAVESFFERLNGGGAIPPGEQFAHEFSTPGWYHYYCIPHETAGMAGNVHVLDG
jgi:plastocyanin